jgi:oligopeptide/dipeptide ABC transporter ATP-binding protein
MTELLALGDLSINASGRILLHDLSLEISTGEIVGLVGASGSGKTLTALAIAGALPDTLSMTGTLTWNLPQDTHGSPSQRPVSMVFQDPLLALDPTMTIGRALRLRLHDAGGVGRRARHDAIEVALAEVGLEPASAFLRRYPHELSGGQRQRVLVAQGLLGNPSLVIADEPTASLDDESTERTLELLLRQIHERGASLLLITHDIGVALRTCDRIAVMYGGYLVELADATTIRDRASHPYTRAIVAAATALEEGSVLEYSMASPEPLEEVVALGSCPYRPRCIRATDACAQEVPSMRTTSQESRVRCIHPVGEGEQQ